MSKRTVVLCDVCQLEVTAPGYVLEETHGGIILDVCSLVCLRQYADKRLADAQKIMSIYRRHLEGQS